MNLDFDVLITTSRFVYLYTKGQLKTLLSGGVFFGICKSPNGYIVLNRNNFDGTGGGNPNGYNSIEYFDKSFQHTGSIQLDFIKDCHQLYCDSDNNVLFTNTGLNLITQITLDGQIGHFAPDKEYNKDINHYNSIYFSNDRWYLCQHRKNDKDDGGIAIFDNQWKFIEYINIGRHAHNCLVQDGYLWSTDSDNGELVRINLETKERNNFKVGNDLMTRGITISGDKILIGLSEPDTRENRHTNKTARIGIYKYPEIEYIDTIEIPDSGQLNDLLSI